MFDVSHHPDILKSGLIFVTVYDFAIRGFFANETLQH